MSKRDMSPKGGREGLKVRTKKNPNLLLLLFFLSHISNHHNFPPTSVQVIVVPYCCLFCVLSNGMLNVSIGIFS